MPARLVVTLNRDERSALGQYAAADLRDPRDQIRYILRRTLEREGYLVAGQSDQPQTNEVPANGS